MISVREAKYEDMARAASIMVTSFRFYNDENKDSYDSNHALIFRDKVKDLNQVLDEILRFYTEKGITPSIYQYISADGYFGQSADLLCC